MNSKSKSKMLSGTAYLIFTVLALAVICLTLYAVTGFFSRRSEPAPAEDTAPVTTPVTKVMPVTEAPVTQPPETKPAAPVTEAPKQEPVDAEPLTFFMPTAGKISKGYSADMPVFSSTMNDYRTHDGIDLEGAVGDVVVCCANGKVLQIWDDPFWGKCVSVDHGSGLCSYYKGLADEIPQSITEGCSVKGGTVIGAVGESAIVEIAQEPHLHFAITVNGASADPCTYLPVEEAQATAAQAAFED